jgi:hypothetical protein
MALDDTNREQFLVEMKEAQIRHLISEEVEKIIKPLVDILNQAKPHVYLRRDDLGIMFKVSPQTVSDWVSHEGFPEPARKIGNTPIWLKSDIDDFMLLDKVTAKMRIPKKIKKNKSNG